MHPIYTRKMASIRKRNPAPGGSGPTQKPLPERGFRRSRDARRRGLDAERQIDRGQTPTKSRIARLRTFGHLIDLHIADMKAVGRVPGRANTSSLAMLRRELGSRSIIDLDRQRLLPFGRLPRGTRREAGDAFQGDIGAIKLVVSHPAVHSLATENVERLTEALALGDRPAEAGDVCGRHGIDPALQARRA